MEPRLNTLTFIEKEILAAFEGNALGSAQILPIIKGRLGTEVSQYILYKSLRTLLGSGYLKKQGSSRSARYQLTEKGRKAQTIKAPLVFPPSYDPPTTSILFRRVRTGWTGQIFTAGEHLEIGPCPSWPQAALQVAAALAELEVPAH